MVGEGNAIALVSHIYDTLPEEPEEEYIFVVILKNSMTAVAGQVEACCGEVAIEKASDQLGFRHTQSQAFGPFEEAVV